MTRAVFVHGNPEVAAIWDPLRAELAALGHRFRTKSDTEVLVHAWEEWGETAFRRMNGQWAAALWDARNERLVLTRDHVGILPLYLCEHRGRLYFASEVKAIFAADPAIPRELDPAGIDETFTFWTVVPPQAVFRGITELPPGVVRVYERSGPARDTAYWHPAYPAGRDGQFRGSLADAAEAVEAALTEATSLRMLRSDVPVGSYLSGGLDSSLVAALGLRAKGDRFNTFSLRFEDAEYDETAFQREMVAFLGSNHHEVVVGRKDIAAAFPDVIRHTERPILRTAPAPLFLLSRRVREAGIKVVLTGEGADEMFAGYDLFREAKVRRFWARVPDSRLRPRLLDRLYPYLARSPVSQQAIARRFFGRNLSAWREPGFSHDTRWMTTASLKRLLSADMRNAGEAAATTSRLLASLPEEFRTWPFLAQDQYLEIRTLLSGYLLSSQGDRMLMAHSVEGRFPFLDPAVMELAASLPPAYKLRVLDEKHVLKRAAAKQVPPSILRRRKQPYRAPDALSFAGDDAPDYVGEMMSERAIRSAGVFDPGSVGRLWQKCRAHKDEAQFSNSDNMALVGVLSVQLLWSQFIRDTPAAPRLPTVRVVDRLAPA